MKKTGTVQVFHDLTLKDFTWRIKTVTYNWESGKACIEVAMKEEGSAMPEHSRTYEFDCNTVWTDEDALNAILSLEQFKGSIEI